MVTPQAPGASSDPGPEGGRKRRRLCGLLRQTAAKIRCLVDAASAVVVGNLRIRTERARPIDLPRSLMGSDDLLRRFALFDPLFHRADLVEGIRTLSA